MPKSTKSRRSSKVQKPYADFPLTPHPSGRWCKKHRGRLHYFGPTQNDDGELIWEAAHERYKREWPYILQGKKPPAEDDPEDDRVTVKEAVNAFLHAKRQLVNSGELKLRTWKDYEKVGQKIINVLGRHRAIEDLKPADFDKLRAAFGKGKAGRQRGPVSVGNDVRQARIIFKYAEDAGLVEKRIRFGPHFKLPSKKVLRQARQANGERMLEAAEIRTLLSEAKQPLRAMILLAINGGLGQTDIANMPLAALDLDNGILDFPRPKTAVPRRIPLWPETVEAVREAIQNRPAPRDTADADMAFLTKYGRRFVRTTDTEKATWTDGIGLQFGKLLRRTKLHKRGRNFYSLRHTFRTVADEVKDQPGIDRVMGHADDSMADLYRERIGDNRLRTVVEHVRQWLWRGKPLGWIQRKDNQ